MTSRLAILAILLPMLLPAYLTLPDRDGDGYSDVRELVTGCDPFDGESVPMCADADGDGIGETLPPAPQCDLCAYGMVPCA